MLRRPITFIALVACVTAAAQSTAPPRVVAPDKLAQYWTMINSSVEADVPNSGRNLQQPGCAAVSFVVEKDGGTSTLKLQRVVPEGDLAKVALSEAGSLKFTPTVSNAGRDRVFSWLIFPFNLPADRAARTAVMQKCQIAKLDWKDR
jgi:hypothetical protein